MKIYVRYALFGVVKYFLAALFCLSVTLLFVLVVQTSLEIDVPILFVLRLVPYLLPVIFSIALPIASLFAATIFFARMGANNEIIALKAMGIAPWRVLVPIWAFMILVSLSGVWFNDLSTSWSRMKQKQALLEGFESMLIDCLRTEKRFEAPMNKYEISVTDVLDDGTLINPKFSGEPAGFNGQADSAKIEVDYDAENPAVHMRLYNAEVEAERARGYMPVAYDFSIPLNEVFSSKTRVDPPITEIKKALNNSENEREQYRRSMASSAMFSFLCGNLDGTATEGWKERASREQFFDGQKRRFQTLFPRFCAAGFACFFFVWVGAPYAILLNKRDFISSFFCAFIPIITIYYVFFIAGLQGAKSGALPPSATWLGNIALGIMGFYFLKKIH